MQAKMTSPSSQAQLRTTATKPRRVLLLPTMLVALGCGCGSTEQEMSETVMTSGWQTPTLGQLRLASARLMPVNEHVCNVANGLFRNWIETGHSAFQFGVYADLKQCAWTVSLAEPGRKSAEQLAAGRVEIDESAFQCAITQRDSEVRGQENCEKPILRGRLEVGQSCLIGDIGCAAGLHCAISSNDVDSQCLGHCVEARTAEPGQKCGPESLCSLGECIDGTCIVAGSLSAGSACKSTECKIGTYCKRTEGDAPGKCAPLPLKDQPCGSAGQCAPGFVCDFAKDRCVPGKRLGDSCSTSSGCASPLVCRGPAGSARCQQLVEPGQPCQPGICLGEDTWCNTRLKQSLCELLPGLGSQCAPVPAAVPYQLGMYTRRCRAPLICGMKSGRCQPLPGLQEECDPAIGCDLGLACVAGSCHLLVGPGGTCLTNPDGQSNCSLGLGCVDGICKHGC